MQRDMPAHFSADSDDIFMRSVMSSYSSEKKNDDGVGLGVFNMGEGQGKALAAEVLGTHKGLKGEALKTYMSTYWSKAWGHFDVNQTGSIEAMKAP
jgi:hypothetical protein